MTPYVFLRKRPRRYLPAGEDAEILPSFWVSVPLLLGAAFGCVIGLFSTAFRNGMLFPVLIRVPDSMGTALFRAAFFVLCVLFASTGILGVLLIPSVGLCFGFCLGVCPAALFSASSFPGLLRAFLLAGIPALLTLPGFLFAAGDGLRFSRSLLRRTDAAGLSRLWLPAFLRRGLFTLLLCFACAMYYRFLLSPLLSLLHY